VKSIRLLLFTLFLTFAYVVPASWAAPATEPQTQVSASLYQRLGGYDAIAAVTDDFITRLATDAQLVRFFAGLSNDSKIKLRQHVVDFLCAATGGPCKYIGRDMKTVHTGLHITEDDWNTSVKDLLATLDKFKVPEKEKNDVLFAISGLKNDIVDR
jgi:hemoglobin